MKLSRSLVAVLTPCCLIALAEVASAATYYVSPSGSDSYSASQAQSITTPWKTIQYAANNMVAGDVCMIRGGTYRETVTVPQSGTSSAPIVFQAYGTEVPVISGADPISGWVSKGGNVYDASAPSLFMDSGSGQVFMNGWMKPEARWPNAGPGFPWNDCSVNPSPDWAYVETAGYDTSNANGWFTDSALPSRTSGYWVGAQVHMMSGYAWIENNSAVTAYDESAKKITTDDSNSDVRAKFTTGNQYYITGKKGEMDSNGEWFYSPSTSTLSFYSSTGVPTGIEAKKRQYGFDLSGRSYINLVNLHFFSCTINSSKTSTYCTFDGLNMKYLAHSENGANVYGVTLRDHFTLKNSELAWDSKGLLILSGSDIKIFNNHLHDSCYTGAKKSMVFNANATGGRNLISHNTMHDAGLGILHSPGVGSVVEYNEFYNACKMCRDDGIVYVGNTDGGNVVFRYNLLHGAPGGVGQKGAPNQGLYLDNGNSGWIIHHNIVWDVPNNGILMNRRHCFHMVFNNDFYGTKGGVTAGYFVGPANEDGESGIHFYNNLIKGDVQRDFSDMDSQFNCPSDPSFVDFANGDFRLQSTSVAKDKGIIIPGVTDGYLGSAPDIGALEYGGTDWTQNVGFQSTPLSPEPVFKYPDMIFCNKVKDGGFESGSLAPNWTMTSGSAISFQSTLWTDDHVRTQYKSLKFDPGTSEIVQTITGLLPNHQYKLYAGVQNLSSSNSVKIGVRNFGRTTKELSSPLASASNCFILNNVSFVTGPSATTADIYIHVSIPSSGSPVYLDDVGLELSEDLDPQVGRMPLLEYPYNETSGTTAIDASTFGRNGTVTGTASWVSGFQGNSLKFDGTSTYVSTPSMTTPTDEITIACWAKSAAATWNSTTTFITQRPAFAFGGQSGSKKFQVMLNLSGVGSTYFGYTPDATFDITGWHQYVATYSRHSGVRSLYVDSILVYSSRDDAPTSIVPTTAAITIGKDSTHFFGGQFDDIRIYDKALQQEEIRALYNVDKTLAIRLKFDETSGSIKAWDCSGFGRNGTLNGFDSSTAWVKGKIGGALSFNGTSSYVSTPGFSTPSTLTIATWARSSSSTWNSDNSLISKEPSFVLGPVKGSKNMKFTIKIGGVAKTVTFTAGSAFDITAWHQYIASYSSSSGNLNLYVDGVLQSSLTGLSGGMDSDSGGLLIGRDDAGTNFLGGQVDDVQVYAREFSANDALALSLRTYGPYDPATVVSVTSNNPPTANAGADKSITLPTNSVTLSGSGVDSDGSIASYSWTQVSPATPLATFSSTTTASTTVSGLQQGSYTFRLTVKDNAGAPATDDVVVTVNAAANVAPIANAGADKTITLPTNSVTLSGSGTDNDGSIASYSWSQVSPTSPAATFSSTTSASPTVSGLLQGSYTFRLTVTDNAGATGFDDVVVTVNSALNSSPSANAGADKTITLPTNSVALSGSGTDTDGSISSYSWSQISGPSTATFSSTTTAATTVSALVQGSYTFRLTVTDNAGAPGSDDVVVTVKAANVAPSANAGADKSITLPTNSVSLSGSGTDTDGSISSYAWSQVSGPSTAAFSSSTTAATTVSALVQGSYTFRLTVKDNAGATGFDDVVVTVNAANALPTANAGADKIVTLPNNTNAINSLPLAGSGSDSDGSIASYAWTQVSGPSTATNSTPNAATTTVGSLIQGTYVFRLTVTDNAGGTASDDVSVKVNAAPISNAGADQTITLPTSSVTLNGSGTDSDGTIVGYTWSQSSGPSTATISSPSSASTVMSGLVQGSYTFRLIVKDDSGATAPDDVVVTVNAAANVSPAANAGADKTITLPTNSVTLNGSGADSDGTISGYAWTQVSGPSTATFSSTTAASTTVSALVQGSYTFRLTVKDNLGAPGTDDVVVTVKAANVAPTANAGADKSITLPTNSVSLTGSGADSDGSIASYAWTQVSGPSTATFSSTTTASTTVSALVQGSYTFRLTVKDNAGASGTDDVIVTVKAANVAPTANAGADQTIVLPTNLATLSGSGTDTDGSISSYAWSQVSGPSTAIFSSTTTASTTVSELVQGSYTFRLTVKDNLGASASDDVVVTVNAANIPPKANAGADKTITLPTSSITVTGTGTDTDGTIASYAWTQVSGPSTAIVSVPTGASTSIGSLIQGVYTFRLTVKDNSGATASDDMKVTVNQVRQFLIDCGPSLKTTPITSGNTWNNLTTARTNDALSGLLDTTAKTSGMGLTVLDGFYQVTAGQGNSNGTTTSTLYPATATADSFFIGTLSGTTDTSAKVRITGLSTSSTTTYKIKLYASRTTTDLTTDRTTVYTINGVAQELQVRNNVDGYVTFDKVTAPNGYLDITITMKTGAIFGYLGVIDVTETSH